MNSLLFCHHYFHFSLQRWRELWPGEPPGRDELAGLFGNDLLPRRRRHEDEPRSFAEAEDLFSSAQLKAEEEGIRAVPEGSPDYPPALLEHVPPERRPAVLYRRGAPLPEERRALALVGTRAPSPEGVEAARSFAAFFTLVDLKIVSGLAGGIDTLVHRENLRAGTVAVLGSSLSEIYPRENAALAEQILSAGGTLLSPFPRGVVPLPANFPQRNELIAALSAGTLVVEGAEKSGAAITGKQSLAMGKGVAVLTGDFRSAFGRGAIRLQQAGATLVADEEEALQALFARLGGFAAPAGPRPAGLFRSRSFSLKDYCARSGYDLPQALARLQEEILTGRVLRRGPDRYQWRAGS